MRFLIFLLLLCLVPNVTVAAPLSPGAAIYRQGVLPDGSLLHGMRAADVNVEGAAAACVTCHRRSGLGTQEGYFVIPPIIGRYLFRPGLRNIEDMNTPHVEGYRPNRNAYTEETLARAIRDGIDANGRELNYLMPRFQLDDASMKALIAYLKDLTSQPMPGVSDDTLHFATIITPDTDPVKRQGMLDVLNQFFADKNAFIRGGHRPMHSAREIMYRVSRRWQLHIWELSGPPETWEQQLHEHQTKEPVFAVISGLGGSNWAPVHRFCEHDSVPCLFPNVDLPVVAENDFYPVYFSKGVLLEKDLIEQQIMEAQPRPQRIVQVFRPDDIGAAAAAALRTALQPAGVQVLDIPLTTPATLQNLGKQLSDRTNNVIVLWLRPPDLAALPALPSDSTTVFVSGLMGELEHAPLRASWRAVARISYPFDPPEQRRIRMNYPLVWFKIHNIPVVDERVQSDTYLACGILAETLSEMLDSFVPDYLVERIEIMLSHRVITGYYPRLGLAQGQRFASKGGYMVRLPEDSGGKLAALGDWIVP